MKRPGDLVNFYSTYTPFLRSYIGRNPGIVLSVSAKGGWGGKQGSAEVLWSNQEITTEHDSYLVCLDKEESCK